MVSLDELERRRRSVEFHRSNSAIEGIFPDDTTRRLEDDYMRGDLTFREFSDALAKLAGVPPDDHDAIDALVKAFERGDISADKFLDTFSRGLPANKDK